MGALYLILVGVVVSLVLICGETTQWKSLSEQELSSDVFAKYYKWRGPFTAAEMNDTALLTASFVSQSPCKVLAIRDNCFSHNPDRDASLLRRTLGATNTLSPPEILAKLRNQAIAFVGDSTVMSTFASFVCYFSPFVEINYDLLWLYKEDFLVSDKQKQDKCPQDASCHLLNALVSIPSHNITLYYQQLNTHRGRERKQLLATVERLFVPTIAIINFGVHYHHAKVFAKELSDFQNDLESILQRQRSAQKVVTQWLWLESFPQHFPQADGSGGMYDSTQVFSRNMSQTRLMCAPVVNEKPAYQNDWRNRLLEQHLPAFKPPQIVRISEALYSQYDAHVDYGDSFRPQPYMDCTHYCTGSGVFRFVIDQILKSVLACVDSGCPME